LIVGAVADYREPHKQHTKLFVTKEKPAIERAHFFSHSHMQVDSIQGSEAIIAVVDAIDRPKEALAMFQPGP
jgi:hypothetical protein